jgi:ribosomal protein S18 acetylase RimI-like enzyme
MAARIQVAPPAAAPRLVDLRRVTAAELDPLLEEESRTWLDLLDWDFSKSADLVRRFVDLRALNGFALRLGRDVVGYSYFVLEDHKGLIGDLYVRGNFRSPSNEMYLLETVVRSLIETPQISRIESQLMMIQGGSAAALPLRQHLTIFERSFMTVSLREAGLKPARLRRPAAIERWSEQHQEPAAHVIAAAYIGHVDSRINDQYRSVPGARRFLYNIVQYPGCGAFFKPASFAAFDLESGRLCGLSLASIVAPDCGHITQICVSPEVRGTGIGYELLRHSLAALREAGCSRASLTVTSSNRQAIDLYERVGFTTGRHFVACVWEGF